MTSDPEWIDARRIARCTSDRESSLLDDLEQMGEDIYSVATEPGWAGTFVLALVILVVSWLVYCTGAAYIS